MLGVVFVLLVCFLRRGLIGGMQRSLRLLRSGAPKRSPSRRRSAGSPWSLRRGTAAGPSCREGDRAVRPDPEGDRSHQALRRPVANSDIDFAVKAGELRGIIGPNGAGKSTFFKMLTCEVPPTSGTIVFEGRDITGMSVTDVCQLGLTKSYQVNQLFTRLTVRENLTIAALAELRGKFRLDLFAQSGADPRPRRAGRAHARAGRA